MDFAAQSHQPLLPPGSVGGQGAAPARTRVYKPVGSGHGHGPKRGACTHTGRKACSLEVRQGGVEGGALCVVPGPLAQLCRRRAARLDLRATRHTHAQCICECALARLPVRCEASDAGSWAPIPAEVSKQMQLPKRAQRRCSAALACQRRRDRRSQARCVVLPVRCAAPQRAPVLSLPHSPWQAPVHEARVPLPSLLTSLTSPPAPPSPWPSRVKSSSGSSGLGRHRASARDVTARCKPSYACAWGEGSGLLLHRTQVSLRRARPGKAPCGRIARVMGSGRSCPIRGCAWWAVAPAAAPASCLRPPLTHLPLALVLGGRLRWQLPPAALQSRAASARTTAQALFARLRRAHGRHSCSGAFAS